MSAIAVSGGCLADRKEQGRAKDQAEASGGGGERAYGRARYAPAQITGKPSGNGEHKSGKLLDRNNFPLASR